MGGQEAATTARGLGVVLSVVSAAGGVGKSSMSMAVAQQCCARGLSTVLIDGDCQFGDCSRMENAATVIPCSQFLSLCESGEGAFSDGLIVVAPDALEYAECHIPQLPAMARSAAQWFDVVVVDTSGVWTDPLLSLMEVSHRVLFVVGQSASSVMGSKRAIDLCLRCSVATGSFLFVLNRCSRHSLFTSIDVSCALGGVHVVEVQEGGAVVEELQGCGLARQLLREGNPFYKSVASVLEEVVPGGQGFRDEQQAGRLSQGGKRARLLATRRRAGPHKRGKHQAVLGEDALQGEEALWR